jgi:GNAT superfamily N-acetyltransferase
LTPSPSLFDDDLEITLRVSEGKPAEWQAIARLRYRAWAPQAPAIRELLPDGQWVDAHDEHAHHLTAWRGGELVAAARLCKHERITELHRLLSFDRPGPFAYISRLVVDPDFRGRGLASRVDAKRAELATSFGARWIVGCWSSLSGPLRLGQLEKQGFQAFSSAPDDLPFPSEVVQWLLKSIASGKE